MQRMKGKLFIFAVNILLKATREVNNLIDAVIFQMNYSSEIQGLII